MMEKLGTELGDNQTFEPDMSKYVYRQPDSRLWSVDYSFKPRYRPKRNANKISIPDVLHVETAIFVDKGKLLL